MSTDQPLDDSIGLAGRGAQLRSLRINGDGGGNGTRIPVDAARPSAGEPPSALPGLDGVNWYTAYDRASVERYLEALDAERVRLEAEIADAERRETAAREALAARTAQLESALGAVVLAARSELDRIEREQQETVAAIRGEAEAEAARIREAAHLEAQTVREAALSLNALSRDEGRSDAG